MQFNGVELEMKMTNAKFAKRYDEAFTKFNEGLNSLPDTLAENIRAQCEAVRCLANTLFGAGTYEKLKIDADDLDENCDFVEKIIIEAKAQTEQYKHRFDKYLPNRSARRNAK